MTVVGRRLVNQKEKQVAGMWGPRTAQLWTIVTTSTDWPVILRVPFLPRFDASQCVDLLVQVPQLGKTPRNVVLRYAIDRTADPPHSAPYREVGNGEVIASTQPVLAVFIQNVLQSRQHHSEAAIFYNEALPRKDLPMQVHLLDGVGKQVRGVGQAAQDLINFGCHPRV
eukprot:UN4140